MFLCSTGKPKCNSIDSHEVFDDDDDRRNATLRNAIIVKIAKTGRENLFIGRRNHHADPVIPHLHFSIPQQFRIVGNATFIIPIAAQSTGAHSAAQRRLECAGIGFSMDFVELQFEFRLEIEQF